MRSAFLAATLPVCLALFRWCKNVRVLDLLLPLQVTIAAALSLFPEAFSSSMTCCNPNEAAAVPVVMWRSR